MVQTADILWQSTDATNGVVNGPGPDVGVVWVATYMAAERFGDSGTHELAFGKQAGGVGYQVFDGNEAAAPHVSTWIGQLVLVHGDVLFRYLQAGSAFRMVVFGRVLTG